MKDPLDDIEAILTSICDEAHSEAHLGPETGYLTDNNVRDDPVEYLSSPKDAGSPKSALDNLIAQLADQGNGSSNASAKGKPQPANKPRTNASKLKKPSTKPTEKIKKHRQAKKTPSKTTLNKPVLLPKADPPVHENTPLVIDDDIKMTTSADEAESNHFLQQMRRLAEQKLQVRAMTLFPAFTIGAD